MLADAGLADLKVTPHPFGEPSAKRLPDPLTRRPRQRIYVTASISPRSTTSSARTRRRSPSLFCSYSRWRRTLKFRPEDWTSLPCNRAPPGARRPQRELIETTERGQMRRGEDSVERVEVYLLGDARTSILGAARPITSHPRELSLHLQANAKLSK